MCQLLIHYPYHNYLKINKYDVVTGIIIKHSKQFQENHITWQIHRENQVYGV